MNCASQPDRPVAASSKPSPCPPAPRNSAPTSGDRSVHGRRTANPSSSEGRLKSDPDLRHFLPDVRDGLTRQERVVLWVLHETQKERGGRNVPTAMLWGRVCEHFYISPDDLSAMLARLGARKD